MNAKRIFVALIIVAILAAVVQPLVGVRAQAGDPYPDEYVWVETTGYINLRSGPSTSYTILGVVPPVTRLLALGRNHAATWVMVEYNGLRGWFAGWLLKVEGDLSTLPDLEGETGDGSNGGTQHCNLDKVATFPYQQGIGPWDISLGGTEWQHASIWKPGILEISFLVKPSVPEERGGVFVAKGFGSLWQDTARRCPNMLSDAIAMIGDRWSNHTGLIFELDLVAGTASLKYNPRGWRVDEQHLLLSIFFPGATPRLVP